MISGTQFDLMLALVAVQASNSVHPTPSSLSAIPEGCSYSIELSSSIASLWFLSSIFPARTLSKLFRGKHSSVSRSLSHNTPLSQICSISLYLSKTLLSSTGSNPHNI
jgi:hypothetical protein